MLFLRGWGRDISEWKSWLKNLQGQGLNNDNKYLGDCQRLSEGVLLFQFSPSIACGTDRLLFFS